VPTLDFNPRDLWGNYNRYAPDELLLSESARERMEHVAFIPPDPALNLLKSGSDFRMDILYKIRESLQVLREVLVPLPGEDELSAVQKRVLRFYLIREYRDPSVEDGMAYCESLFSAGQSSSASAAAGGFAPRIAAREYFKRELANPLTQSVGQSLKILDEIIGAYEGGRGLTGDLRRQFPVMSNRLLRSFSLLDRLIQRSGDRQLQRRFGHVDLRMLRNTLGLAFFYYAMLRLLDHDEVQSIVRGFIPRKRAGGKLVRDRHRQIMLLLKKDQQYHKRFFHLVKALFPMMERQMHKLARHWKLEAILLRDETGAVRRNVYLKLLSELMHDLLNAGLGVHVGIRLNRARPGDRYGLALGGTAPARRRFFASGDDPVNAASRSQGAHQQVQSLQGQAVPVYPGLPALRFQKSPDLPARSLSAHIGEGDMRGKSPGVERKARGCCGFAERENRRKQGTGLFARNHGQEPGRTAAWETPGDPSGSPCKGGDVAFSPDRLQNFRSGSKLILADISQEQGGNVVVFPLNSAEQIPGSMGKHSGGKGKNAVQGRLFQGIGKKSTAGVAQGFSSGGKR
jgi:hypothetical protein